MMPHPSPHYPMMGEMPPEGMHPPTGGFDPIGAVMAWLNPCPEGISPQECKVMTTDETIHKGIAEGKYQNIDFNQFPAWDEYREKYMSGTISTYKKEEILSRIQRPTEVARLHKPQDGPIIPQIPHKPTEAPPPLPHLLEPQMKPPADGLFHEIPPEDPTMLADILANLAEIPKMFFEPKRLPSGLPPHCYDMARGQPIPEECRESEPKPMMPPMMAQVGEEEINEEELLRQEREEEVGKVDKTHENAVVSQAGENAWAEKRDDFLGGKAMNYKTEIAAIVTKYKVKPVDCQMTDWSPWTNCLENADGTWAKTKNRNVLVKPQHGGKDCPTNQDTKNCPPIDCKYEKWSDWSECELAHTEGEGTGTQSRHRNAIMPANGGTACDSTLQYEERECSMPSETVAEPTVVEPTVVTEVIVEPVVDEPEDIPCCPECPEGANCEPCHPQSVPCEPTIVEAIVQLFTPEEEVIVAPVITDTSTVQQEVIPVQTGLPAEPTSSSISITDPSPPAEAKPATIDTPEDEAKEEKDESAKVEPEVEEKKSRWPWVVGGLAIVGGGYYLSKRK